VFVFDCFVKHFDKYASANENDVAYFGKNNFKQQLWNEPKLHPKVIFVSSFIDANLRKNFDYSFDMS